MAEEPEVDLQAEIFSLLNSIEYQVFQPPVTTIGKCPNCHMFSRGAQMCARCLTQKLGYIVGTKLARNYYTTIVAYREARNAIVKAGEQK